MRVGVGKSVRVEKSGCSGGVQSAVNFFLVLFAHLFLYNTITSTRMT